MSLAVVETRFETAQTNKDYLVKHLPLVLTLSLACFFPGSGPQE